MNDYYTHNRIQFEQFNLIYIYYIILYYIILYYIYYVIEWSTSLNLGNERSTSTQGLLPFTSFYLSMILS